MRWPFLLCFALQLSAADDPRWPLTDVERRAYGAIGRVVTAAESGRGTGTLVHRRWLLTSHHLFASDHWQPARFELSDGGVCQIVAVVRPERSVDVAFARLRCPIGQRMPVPLEMRAAPRAERFVTVGFPGDLAEGRQPFAQRCAGRTAGHQLMSDCWFHPGASGQPLMFHGVVVGVAVGTWMPAGTGGLPRWSARRGLAVSLSAEMISTLQRLTMRPSR